MQPKLDGPSGSSLMKTDDIPGGVNRVPMFVNGAFPQSSADTWYPVHDPSTNRLLSVVPQCLPDEVDQAVMEAHQAFPAWRRTTLMHRQQRMFELARLIRQHIVC
jgi:malonate-semialdehyde dehydrogenase (acetylating)/methylmalonate-semialdehyde dehydrogenase